MATRRVTIFLSHASADAALASFVEDTLRASIPGCEVFRTSRRGQLATGHGWFEEIEKALRKASAFVLLITPQSQDRWWVMFEAGAALRSGKSFVPLLVGDLAPPSVNEPLKYLTLVRAADAVAASDAIASLGGELQNPVSFVSECARLSEVGRQAGLDAQKWDRTEFEGYTYVWGGPLSQFSEETAVQEPLGLAAHLTELE